MEKKIRVERPSQTITAKILPISSELKGKIALAVNEVVNKIKEKHLS